MLDEDAVAAIGIFTQDNMDSSSSSAGPGATLAFMLLVVTVELSMLGAKSYHQRDVRR